MILHRLKRSGLYLLIGVSCAGCFGGGAKKPDPPDTNAQVAEAGVLADQGQTAKALSLLDAAAKGDPASAKPWLKKAQIQFQTADYPSAIQSAEEAAKRDPADKEARSVAIVSALRIAIRGLVELRGQKDLGENAYAEAQRLSSVLKASLGTDTLVPAEDANAAGVTSPSSTVGAPGQPASIKRVAPAPPPRPVRTPPRKPDEPAKPANDPGADPFKDLH